MQAHWRIPVSAEGNPSSLHAQPGSWILPNPCRTIGRLVGAVGLCLSCALPSLRGAGAPSLEPALRIVEEAVARQTIPGASILIMRHGKTVAARSFGLRELNPARPFREDTLCWIASLTKPVTATAAMVLVEQGKLDLEAPVETYLPAFAGIKTQDGKDATIRVRQLMSQSSGIAAGVPLRPSFFFTQSWYDRSLESVVSAIAERPLLFQPGEATRYSNAAPYVMGRIIELQSGQPFGDFVRQHVLDKLGMSDTGFAIPPDEVHRAAVVYRRKKEEVVEYCRYDKDWKVEMCMPDGGLFSTTADMARFAHAFLNQGGGVVGKDSIRTMLTRQSDGYGLGWILDGENQFSHWGSSGTLVWADRKTGLVGVFFAQIQDISTLDKIHHRFREAVTEAFADD